jgi:hypothetical protein
MGGGVFRKFRHILELLDDPTGKTNLDIGVSGVTVAPRVDPHTLSR